MMMTLLIYWCQGGLRGSNIVSSQNKTPYGTSLKAIYPCLLLISLGMKAVKVWSCVIGSIGALQQCHTKVISRSSFEGQNNKNGKNHFLSFL